MGEAPEIKSGTEGLRETPPRIPDGPGRFACMEGTQERLVRPSAPTRICRSRAGDLGQLTRGPELVPPPLLSETRGISGRGVLGASVLLAACRSGCRRGGAAEAGRGVGQGHSEWGCGPSALASYLCELGRVAQHRRVLFNPGKSLVK